MKQILNEDTLTIECVGKGKNKKEAYDMCFSNLRSQVNDKKDRYIVYMFPTSVEEVETTVNEYTERFLFFFWPKKREDYEIKLKVTTDIKYL